MRRNYFMRAAMPAALLLVTQAAMAQQPSTMVLEGPSGEPVLQIAKSIPADVRAGELFEYQILVQNVSDSAVMNVTVVEQVEGLQIRSVQPRSQSKQKQGAQKQQKKQQSSAQQKQKKQQQKKNAQNKKQKSQGKKVKQQGNRIRYKIGMLAAGQSELLTVSAVASKPGPAKACMWVDYQPTLCTVIEVVQPDFRLIGRLLYDRGVEVEGIKGVYGCDRVFLVLEVISTGEAATAPAEVVVDLPAGLTTEDGAGELKLELGPLEPEKAVERRVPLMLNADQIGSEIALPIVATAGELSAKITLPAVPILNPDLQLSVEAPSKVYIDRRAEIPVTITNSSDAPVLSAMAYVKASADLDDFTAEGADLTEDGAIALGRIEPGQSRKFTLLMSATRPTDATVTVKTAGYCVEAVSKQAKLNIVGIPALLVEVVDAVDPVPVGEMTTYEISIKNQGTARDTNIQLTAMLPDDYAFIRATGPTEVTVEGQNVSFGSLKELAPGDVAQWTLQVKAEQADKVRLKIKMTSDATEKPITEEEPTTLFGDNPPVGDREEVSETQEGAQQQTK